MGRPRELPGRPKTEGPKCKKCRKPLLHIGRQELDSNRIVEGGFTIIRGKVGWGGQKLYDVFFCDKCKRTYLIEVERY